ncbi:MAG: NUDIX hydrolase [Chitinophagaceae bacterium]
MKWRILSSEYLFSDLWFKVRRDRCETPDGKIVEPYYVYEFPTWVTAVAITKDGQVIMERQYRHALGEVCLEIPGGCVDDTDANLEVAIRRELKEETGYEFEKLEYLGKISANPSTNNNLMHMFLATGGTRTAEQELDHNEEIQIELISIDELKGRLERNEIVQSMHASCIFYALRKLGLY